MSIKHGLLALLEHGPAYGYQLRSAFEKSTGSTWPLNIGQVYSTLSRLERDGLVEALPESEKGQQPYTITEKGRATVNAWFNSPVVADQRPRDELTIKVALALCTPGVNIPAVIQAQRSSTLRTLQEYTRMKFAAGHDDTAWTLILDAMIFKAEAEVRWLDHTETALRRNPPHQTSPLDLEDGESTPSEPTVAEKSTS
ncbi:PadR family transcriptional regulator [Natronoglycomyces albus]|uniref:PadR family transcriptional regulator n=1 Tax=Natronoglycomyces albus TaxID=2811108 RepID=A0A895XKH4_9ACTN|nr:PadR family transcriptional regulator [Natronoglycomyces albus]QSB06241.1 PadR family transcriptional regulator [Natronoglycomyces albus]